MPLEGVDRSRRDHHDVAEQRHPGNPAAYRIRPPGRPGRVFRLAPRGYLARPSLGGEGQSFFARGSVDQDRNARCFSLHRRVLHGLLPEPGSDQCCIELHQLVPAEQSRIRRHHPVQAEFQPLTESHLVESAGGFRAVGGRTGRHANPSAGRIGHRCAESRAGREARFPGACEMTRQRSGTRFPAARLQVHSCVRAVQTRARVNGGGAFGPLRRGSRPARAGGIGMSGSVLPRVAAVQQLAGLSAGAYPAYAPSSHPYCTLYRP